MIMAKKVQTADEKVLALIEEVKRRKATVGKLKRPTWRTTCSLQLPGWDRLNIQIENDRTVLAVASGVLKDFARYCNEAEKDWDCQLSRVWKSFPIEDWLADIELRVSVMSLKSEQDKLKRLEDQLSRLMSPDQRRELELAQIEQELA